jgi:ADP-heptose:LPS heptosyltransferase
MDENEKEINLALAKSILSRSGVGRVLDIGSNYPFLAHCFEQLGCEASAMDCLPGLHKLGEEMGVDAYEEDFEQFVVDEQKFKIITMVNSFNYMRDPLAVLHKLRELVEDDGIVYLRLPDHGIDGFEQHISSTSTMVHPNFWSQPSLLELLVQAKNLFVISGSWPLQGGGQRDVMLKPITAKPKVSCGMIVKNEERDLPKCLESIKDVIDNLVIIDTGSTDKTQDVAVAFCVQNEIPLLYKMYTGSSKQDSSGDWKLWDFGTARNQFVQEIEHSSMRNTDYLLWMDADDNLVTSANARRAFYLSNVDVIGMMVSGGDGTQWVHHRAWKTGQGIEFKGRIHEYPDFGNGMDKTVMVMGDIIIHHDSAPGFGESSNERNLRILELDMKEEPNTRTAFYLANTHKDAARWLDAVKYYQIRIDMGVGYRDEWLFAWLYKGRCERAAKLYELAERTLLGGLSHAPSWSEFWMELAYLKYDQKEWNQVIGYSMEALSRNPEHTQLWRELNKYTDQPRRMLSFAHEFLGDKPTALYWATEALKYIGVDDTEWNNRILNLKQGELASRFLKKNVKPKIALHRPGAIGDIIMTLNLIPMLKKKYPKHDIHYYCNVGIGEQLSSLFTAVEIEWFDCSHLESKIGMYEKVINLIGYPLHEGYPNVPMKKHLLEYFADEMGLGTRGLPQLHLDSLSLTNLPNRPYITVHPLAGWSLYKNWAMGRWEKLIEAFPNELFIQIGSGADYKLQGADHSYMGTELSNSIDLIANATLHLGIDSFSNHLTHYKWNGRQTPAIILWGSTQWQAAGYPENVNISLGLECQPCFREDPKISAMPRGVCINPPGQTDYNHPQHACMAGISVDQVIDEVKKIFDLTTVTGSTGGTGLSKDPSE